MKLKRTILLIAIGFIITLVNINVRINSSLEVNFLPDFIGWLLIAYACSRLGRYVRKKPFYLIVPVLLGFADLGIMMLKLLLPKYDLSIAESIVSLFSIIFIFALLSLLEKVGKDNGYGDIASIRILKYVYLISYLIFQSLALSSAFIPFKVLSVLLSVSGGAALLTAILTAYVLVKMAVLIDREEE